MLVACLVLTPLTALAAAPERGDGIEQAAGENGIVPITQTVYVTETVREVIPVVETVYVTETVQVQEIVPVVETVYVTETVRVELLVPVTQVIPVEQIVLVEQTVLVTQVVPVEQVVRIEQIVVVTETRYVEQIVPVTQVITVEQTVLVTEIVPVEQVVRIEQIVPVTQTVVVTDIVEVEQIVPLTQTVVVTEIVMLEQLVPVTQTVVVTETVYALAPTPMEPVATPTPLPTPLPTPSPSPTVTPSSTETLTPTTTPAVGATGTLTATAAVSSAATRAPLGSIHAPHLPYVANWLNLAPGYYEQTPLPAGGLAMYYAPYVMDRVVDYRERVNNLEECTECIGRVALLRAGDIGRRVWIQAGDGAVEGPYYVTDVAARHDIPGLLRRGWVVDVDWETGQHWRMRGPIPVTVYAEPPAMGEPTGAATATPEPVQAIAEVIIP